MYELASSNIGDMIYIPDIQNIKGLSAYEYQTMFQRLLKEVKTIEKIVGYNTNMMYWGQAAFLDLYITCRFLTVDPRAQEIDFNNEKEFLISIAKDAYGDTLGEYYLNKILKTEEDMDKFIKGMDVKIQQVILVNRLKINYGSGLKIAEKRLAFLESLKDREKYEDKDDLSKKGEPKIKFKYYYLKDNKEVDLETLDRINKLGLAPAYKDVFSETHTSL